MLTGCERAEQVRFNSAGATLAGEIWKPKTGGSFPAAVFLPGPDARERKGMHALAEHLAEQGIASLFYEKYGAGESSGDWTKADFQTLASEAIAALQYLRGREDVGQNHIGVIGFGQGGGIALLVAAASPEVSFVIALSTPVLGEFSTDSSTRVRDFEPLSILSHLRAPVLVLYGANDLTISVDKSVASIEASLRQAGKKNSALRVVPNADHRLFTTPFHDSPLPLLRDLPLSPRFEPEALEAMVYWIKVVAPLHLSRAK